MENLIPIPKLIEALDHNFEGRNTLSKQLMNRVPKFGNDEDFVDLLANEVFHLWADSLKGYTNPGVADGFLPLHPDGQYRLRGRCGATPDGRKAGRPSMIIFTRSMGGRARPTAVARSGEIRPGAYSSWSHPQHAF
jgi:formate C-acetyltransferase